MLSNSASPRSPPSPRTPQKSSAPSVPAAAASPRSSRKRNNDEAWSAGSLPLSSLSPRRSISMRPNTAPELTAILSTALQNPFQKLNLGTMSEQPLSDPSIVSPRKQPRAQENSSQDTGELRTFGQRIHSYQSKLDEDYDHYAQELQNNTSPEELESLDWSDLEAKYHDAMEPITQEEEELFRKFSQLFTHFQLWMQVCSTRESERAFKRLCTRIAFVQNSEAKLANKVSHFEKVLSAFQSAMALLSNPSS